MNSRSIKRSVTAVFAVAFSFLTVLLAAPVAGAEGVGIQIIGGSNATTPWAVSLQTFSSADMNWHHRCGGALITPNAVLTSAHCLAVIQPGTRARVGSLNWKEGGDTATVVRVDANPAFDPGFFDNDIALVQLDHNIAADTGVQFALGDFGNPNSISTVAGWGTTCNSDVTFACRTAFPDMLQQLDEKRLPDPHCAFGFGDTPFFIRGSMVCTVAADGQFHQACAGDSGTPLFKQIDGVWAVVGLVIGDGDDNDIRPNGCITTPDGDQGKMDVTKIAAHVDWITQTLQQYGPFEVQNLVRQHGQD